MKISDEWWTAPAEGTDGRLVIVTGRDDIDDIRTSGKYIYRIDVSWRYNALPDGMPEPADAALMEQVDDALKEAFRKDPAGVITGIYTGDGERDWVIYTRSLHIFSKIFNRPRGAPHNPVRNRRRERPRMGGIPTDARRDLHRPR